MKNFYKTVKSEQIRIYITLENKKEDRVWSGTKYQWASSIGC